jgi:hypothetical protein
MKDFKSDLTPNFLMPSQDYDIGKALLNGTVNNDVDLRHGSDRVGVGSNDAAVDGDRGTFDFDDAHAFDHDLPVRHRDGVSVRIFDHQAALGPAGRLVLSIPQKPNEIRKPHVAMVEGH